MGDFNVYPDNNLLKPIYEKMKEKLADYKVIEHGVTPPIDPRVEELKSRVTEIETEILETVKGVKDASPTVMRYINENVERLEDEKRQTLATMKKIYWWVMYEI